VLRASVAVHPPSGFALYTKWDDIGHLDIRADAADIVRFGLEKGYFTAWQALGLLRLGWDGSATGKLFLQLLSRCAAEVGRGHPDLKQMIGQITHWVLRDLSSGACADTARELTRWLRDQRLDGLENYEQLQAYLGFVKAYPDSSRVSTIGEHLPSYRAERTGIDWDAFFERNGGFGPDNLNRLFHALRTERSGYLWRGSLFPETRARLVPSQRAAYLDALLELPSERLYGDDLLSEWEQCLGEWQRYPSVRDWSETGMPKLTRRFLPCFIGYPYQAAENLQRFLALPFVGPERGPQLLSPALAEWVDSLQAWQLYLTATAMAQGLEHNQRKALFLDSLKRGEAAMENRKPLAPLARTEINAADRNRALATLISVLLGHPDTRIRWRCLHGLREMQLQRDPDLLAALVSRLDEKDAPGFLPLDAHFYWISARTYLLLFLERFTKDCPDALLPHANRIARYALDNDFPHVQIRELAKRAVLAVVARRSDVLGDETIHRLRQVNAPIGTSPERSQTTLRRHAGEREQRFRFDVMDTLPYWYSHLGHLFEKSPDEVAELAEHWICDEWGFFGDRALFDRREKRERYDWGLVSHRHGTLPTVENLQTYLEFQGMQLAAGRLIDSQPVKRYLSDDALESWTDWMRPYLPSHDDYWLSELRDAIPLQPELHGLFPPLDEWLEPKCPDAFDRCLGLFEDADSSLIVAASVDTYSEDRHEDSSVASAFVSPETARALLRALQTANDPHDYRIPPAGDDQEIDNPQFRLAGWLKHLGSTESLDRNDPLLYRMSAQLPILIPEIQEALRVRSEHVGIRYLDQVVPHRLVAEIHAWSDMPERDTKYDSFSQGWRLQIRTDRLLQLLTIKNTCLILKVQIRRDRRNHGKLDYDYAKTKALVYLLHPDGRLETLEHDRRLGQEK